MAIFSLNEVRTEQIKNIANDNFESWPESATYGYFGGGFAFPGGQVNTVDRLDLFTEATSVPGNNLPQARSGSAAVSNNSYGYFGGGVNSGLSPSIVATIDRIDFSNETTSAPGNNLTQARSSLAACSSSSYGYFGGGFVPPYVDTIDRIDFSNETTSPVTATLPEGRSGLAAVSSSSYGYFAGGGSPGIKSTIDRIDFSNETVTASTQLVEENKRQAAVSN